MRLNSLTERFVRSMQEVLARSGSDNVDVFFRPGMDGLKFNDMPMKSFETAGF
jgi:hypothetical protein